MPSRRAFKTDESFLEKISIGAMGTRRVFAHLKETGHYPIELERGSMSFKIWRGLKIKRVRVPDLLCVGCGKRIESRAKTKLEISMSHSTTSPERGWDNGLIDEDAIAFVPCSKMGEAPIDWQASKLVQYIGVKALRSAFKSKNVIEEKPKGAQEGFEVRVKWPSAIASADGKVSEISSSLLKFKRNEDNRTVTLRLVRNGITLKPTVAVNNDVLAEQIVASVVPVQLSLPCGDQKDTRRFQKLLESSALSDRYTAAKAIPHLKDVSVAPLLRRKIADTREHIYIRLECAASLLRLGIEDEKAFFEQVLADQYLENRLECVITLGEIQNELSTVLLIRTLEDKEQDAEIRSGAAWALGELRSKKAISALVSSFSESDLDIRGEAARALLKMLGVAKNDVVKRFSGSSEEARAGIAWALSKSGQFKIEELLLVMADDEARKWMAWVIGTQKEERFISEIESLKQKDHEVYFAVTVLWKILSSWIKDLEIY